MTIDTKQLFFILDNIPSEQNIMLVGKHGIGKSRILEKYFEEKNAKVVTLFLGQMSDPGDLIGLPEKNEKTGKTDFMLPYWFPTDDKPIVLFLDELNRARPEVLQTIMDLTLNRKLAGKSLPKGSRIISAVNNGTEYQLTDLDPALVSRFNIYEFNPSVEDWLLWAEKEGIDQRIISFISQNPEFLDSTDIEAENENLERTPDRRSWERCSKILEKFSFLTNEHKIIFSGILGNRATVEFFRFTLENNQPSAKKILTSDFNSVCEQLKKLSSVDLTQVNVSLFRFIETKKYAESEEDLICKNLKAYLDFLQKEEQKEILSHFVGLCNASEYPETLALIGEKSPDLYQSIINFVMDF